MIKKVVLIGGGVGSSTFTKALKNLPITLSTIVNTFDDGGSTGSIRRDYKGIALGDIRQCILASLDLDEDVLKALNYRFGRGSLFSVNTGNLLLKSFIDTHANQRAGILRLHKILKLRNKITPVSYSFARIVATTTNGTKLTDQEQIANYLSFASAPIKRLGLSKPVKISEEAKKAIIEADYLIFAPGHFFTSLLPHIFVGSFSTAWKRSKAKKIWCVNLLAHKGQDSFFTLKDYLKWFQKKLGEKPFTDLIINESVSREILEKVRDRFELIKITNKDKKSLKDLKIKIHVADLVSPIVRGQLPNDTVLRAPLRHDTTKIKKYFSQFLDV